MIRARALELTILVLTTFRLHAAARLCVVAGEDFRKGAACIDVDARRMGVEPADVARRYVWTSEAGQDLWLGLVPARDTSVARRDAIGIQLQLSAEKGREWPVDVTVDVTEKLLGRWTFALTAKQAAEPVTLHLAHGTYDIRVKAPGYEVLHQKGIVASMRVDEALKPAVRVAAKVIDANGEPVAFAAMRAECAGRPLCETAVDGRLMCELARPVPPVVCVDGPNVGRKRVTIDAKKLDVDLGTLVLRRGTTLFVETVDLPAGTSLSLLRKRARIETRTEPPFVFEDVEAGDYALRLQGPEPAQRVTIPVTVAATAEQKVTLDFTPYKLTGIVRFGDKPLPGAAIELQEDDWTAKLRTDDEGRFAAQLWSPAAFAVFVSVEGLSEPFATMKRSSLDDNDWTLVVPNRKIGGRVSDATSGAPVAGATIQIESDDGNVHSSRSLISGNDGTYEFPAATAGTHSVKVMANDYLPPEMATFKLTESDRERRLDFALQRGKGVRLRVLDERGVPLPNALVLDLARVRMTDTEGIATLTIAEKSIATVYVLPPDGSLAVARVSDDDAVHVPSAAGAIRLRAERESGQPIPGLVVRVRMNGDLLPREVLRQFARLHGLQTTTDASGELLLPTLPAGIYETCLGDCDAIAAWTRVAVTSGETRVMQRYAAK